MDHICTLAKEQTPGDAWAALTSGLVIGAIIIGVTVMDETETQAAGMATGIQNDGCSAALSAADNNYGLSC